MPIIPSGCIGDTSAFPYTVQKALLSALFRSQRNLWYLLSVFHCELKVTSCHTSRNDNISFYCHQVMSHLALLLSFFWTIPRVLCESVNCYLPPPFLHQIGQKHTVHQEIWCAVNRWPEWHWVKFGIPCPLPLCFFCVGSLGPIAMHGHHFFFIPSSSLIISLGSAPAPAVQVTSRGLESSVTKENWTGDKVCSKIWLASDWN